MIGLFCDQRRADHQRLHDARMCQPGAARHLEALLVPRLLGLADVLDPAFRRGDALVRCHDLVHEARLQRLGRRQVGALRHELQRGLDADQSRQALRAAAARQQADLDLRQTEHGLRVVGRDAIMAREADLESAAERGAVDGRRERLAAGLELAQQLLQVAAVPVNLFGALAAVEGVDELHQVRARDERVLAGCQHRAFDRVVRRHLVDAFAEFAHELRRQHVHGAVLDVNGGERDTVAVNLEINRVHVQSLVARCAVPVCSFRFVR